MAFPRKPRCRDKNEHTEDNPPQRSESKLEIFKQHFEALTKLKENEVWILTHNLSQVSCYSKVLPLKLSD